jgi:hypothetical protein
MFVIAFGALLAAVGVGCAIGAPLIGLELERKAAANRQLAAQDRLIADQELTIEAYREFATQDELVA